MANPDASSPPLPKPGLPQPTVRSHIAYMLLSGLAIMVMFSLLRLALLAYNREMILTTPFRPSSKRSATVCASTCASPPTFSCR